MDKSDSEMALNSKVLIVAGTDPTGGAGIVRDIETTSHFGIKAALAVTSVNVQDDQHVEQKMPVTGSIIQGQMLAALKTDTIAAIKIGMTGSASVVIDICEALKQFPKIPVILDPVITASSGGALADGQTVMSIKHQLMQISLLITPNLAELAELSDSSLAKSHEEAIKQAQKLLDLGASYVLVKGGHEKSETSVDSLVSHQSVIDFAFPRLNATMRGTGCTLSTAIACQLALGKTLAQAIKEAKNYVYSLLKLSQSA